jgi:hypothetical protein
MLHNKSDVGSLKVNITRTGNDYTKTTNAKIKIFLFHKQSTLVSKGHFGKLGFAPHNFSYSDDSNNKFSRSLTDNEQDSLSYTLQLQYLLAHGKKNMPIKVYMNKKLQQLDFKVRAHPTLSINNQKMHTTYVTADVSKGVVLRLWFAPHLDYALVKTETVKDGKVVLNSELTHYAQQKACFY